MLPPLAGALATDGSDRRHGFWRSALSGLTPQVVAIVAALLFIRVLSSSIEQVILAANSHELGAWFWDLFKGSGQLLLTAAPMLVVIIATANLGPQHGPKRIAALTAAVIFSAGAGALLRIVSWHFFGWTRGGWDVALDMLSYAWARYAILGGMLTVVGEFYRREMASTKAMQQAEIDRVAFEREMTEARLQVLQAQIEPHFLFNTLANVRRLYDKDRAAGGKMLENLMRYLEVALPQMRDNESTLGRDAELVEAFLRIQQIRMGQRLAFSIDIPVALRAHPMPPMMLLTLAENAIKHGLSPSLDGGRIHVMARADGDRLILSVADTGLGFAPGSGAGTGLANVCARLAAQFGNRASLALENNELGGATAMIVLPLADVARRQ
ncbi:MAG TPA: histidine kinase [Casimicrobiaceae bacterium]|jgi:signal transduction histidine kinase|nr:histidine kinase [Casimicrobiaceae bacterium]